MDLSLSGIVFTAFAMLAGYGIITFFKNHDRRSSDSMLLYAVATVGILMYGGLLRGNGWAADTERLPEEFIFVHGLVSEPDPQHGKQGAIWVMIRVVSHPDSPYLVHLPYSPGMASDIKHLTEIARIKADELPVRVKKPDYKNTTNP